MRSLNGLYEKVLKLNVKKSAFFKKILYFYPLIHFYLFILISNIQDENSV